MKHFYFRLSFLRVKRPNLSSRAERGICFLLTRRAAICFIVFLSAIFIQPATATIQYEVSFAKPSEHLFHITMTVPDVHDELTVQMPAWNALYEIRDFSSRIQRVEASSGAQLVAHRKARQADLANSRGWKNYCALRNLLG